MNEIEGISDYAAFVKAGKEEFNKTSDKGVGMTFWILGVGVFFFCFDVSMEPLFRCWLVFLFSRFVYINQDICIMYDGMT